MHLGCYVRHHSLDDNGEVGGIGLALATDRNWRWRVRVFRITGIGTHGNDERIEFLAVSFTRQGSIANESRDERFHPETPCPN